MTLVSLLLALLAQPAPKTACETIGPRLDGTYVTICAGSVVRTTSSAPKGPFTYLRPESR